MGKMEDLAKRIETQRVERENAATEAQQSKDEWVQEVRRLLSQLEEWLQPLASKKLVNIVRSTITLNEELFGAYAVESMSVSGPGWKLQVTPIGRIIIGAKGRVDIACKGKRSMLVRHADGWKIAVRRDRGFDYFDLTEDTFAELFEGLTD